MTDMLGKTLGTDRRSVMAYGHAERNLALIRQLEAETSRLLESLDRPDAKRAACRHEGTASTAAADAD